VYRVKESSIQIVMIFARAAALAEDYKNTGFYS